MAEQESIQRRLTKSEEMMKPRVCEGEEQKEVDRNTNWELGSVMSDSPVLRGMVQTHYGSHPERIEVILCRDYDLMIIMKTNTDDYTEENVISLLQNALTTEIGKRRK